MEKTGKQKVGELGEQIACEFLVKRGYSVLDRNYRKKWGEIDIIALRDGITHFIEVKSVSRENRGEISRGTSDYRPEENVHPAKLRRLSRTIQSYLIEKGIEDREWVFDVAAVFLAISKKEARVRFTENIVL